MKYIATLSLVAAMLLAGCNNRPSVGTAKEEFSKLIDKESGGVVSLQSFEKTNGAKQNILGQDAYSISFEGTVRFGRNGYLSSDFAGMDKFSMVGSRPSELYMMPSTEYFAGAEGRITGDLTFVPTENGWELQGYKLREDSILKNPNPIFGLWKAKSASPGCGRTAIKVDSILITADTVRYYAGYMPIPPIRLGKGPKGTSFQDYFDLGDPDGPPSQANYHRFRATVSDDGTELHLDVPDVQCTLTFSKHR